MIPVNNTRGDRVRAPCQQHRTAAVIRYPVQRHVSIAQRRRMSSTTAAYTVVVPGTHLMPALCGPRDVFLRQIEQAFPAARLMVRGNEIHLDGPDAEAAGRLIEELVAAASSAASTSTTPASRVRST